MRFVYILLFYSVHGSRDAIDQQADPEIRLVEELTKKNLKGANAVNEATPKSEEKGTKSAEAGLIEVKGKDGETEVRQIVVPQSYALPAGVAKLKPEGPTNNLQLHSGGTLQLPTALLFQGLLTAVSGSPSDKKDEQKEEKKGSVTELTLNEKTPEETTKLDQKVPNDLKSIEAVNPRIGQNSSILLQEYDDKTRDTPNPKLWDELDRSMTKFADTVAKEDKKEQAKVPEAVKVNAEQQLKAVVSATKVTNPAQSSLANAILFKNESPETSNTTLEESVPEDLPTKAPQIIASPAKISGKEKQVDVKKEEVNQASGPVAIEKPALLPTPPEALEAVEDAQKQKSIDPAIVPIDKEAKKAVKSAFVGAHGDHMVPGIADNPVKVADEDVVAEKDKTNLIVGNNQDCGNPDGQSLLCLQESLCLDSKQKHCQMNQLLQTCKCYETAPMNTELAEKKDAATTVVVVNKETGRSELTSEHTVPDVKPPIGLFNGYYGILSITFMIIVTLFLLSRGNRRSTLITTPNALEEWSTFMNCPNQLRLALFLTFLDSIRFFCGVSAVPLLLSNEYGFSDGSSATIAANTVLVAVIFGFFGAYLVDRFDSIVNISRLGTSLSFISRMILVFFSAGSTVMVLLCTLFFFPLVEGCLGPSFRTAIVRLSTNETRSFNFAMLYGIQSLGGAFGFMIVDWVKDDVHVVFGQTMSGIRYTFFISGIVMFVAAGMSIFLKDVRLETEENDQLDDESQSRVVNPQDDDGLRGKRHAVDRVLNRDGNDEESSSSAASGLLAGSTASTNAGSTEVSTIADNDSWYSSIASLFRSHATWQVLTFSTCTTFCCMQWQFSETLLPKYLTRIHGTGVPWGSISSLNMWGCVFGPPLAAAIFSDMEDFDVIIPGIVLFSLSPLCMVTCESDLIGSVLWMILMTLGEVIWSPRFQAYAASLCPKNQQAMFLTLVAMPRILFSWFGTLMGGILLNRFIPPCSQCADDYGYFCDTITQSGGCKSSISGMECLTSEEHPKFCAPTCQDCPNWVSDVTSLWSVILCLSLISPLLISANRDYFALLTPAERIPFNQKVKALKSG